MQSLKFAKTVNAPKNTGIYTHRVLIGVPTLGVVRIEWHNAMNGIVIPVNWSNSYQTPIGFQVDDAQNLIVKEAIDKGFEWLILIEDDVVVPCDIFITLSKYIKSKKYPIVSGLYNLKGSMPQPFIFRGRGNGSFTKFKNGDKVMADGVPTGCLLVHCSVLKELAKTSEDYELRVNGNRIKLKKIFWTPRIVYTDVSLSSYQKLIGTSDLWFCDRIIKEGILKKTGWKREGFPFLVDTSIFCGHIDRETGQIY